MGLSENSKIGRITNKGEYFVSLCALCSTLYASSVDLTLCVLVSSRLFSQQEKRKKRLTFPSFMVYD
jgi:hypothetical protein